MHHRVSSVRSRAFTLVELVIVIAVLGILGALVIPKFSNAADTARANTLREDLRYLRTQAILYRAQHNNVFPGYPAGDTTAAPSVQDFVNQMTMHSDEQGVTNAAATSRFKFGPYLLRMPVNPIAGNADVRLVASTDAFPTEPAGPEGWVYQPSTGTFAPNVAGVDPDGQAYFDY